MLCYVRETLDLSKYQQIPDLWNRSRQVHACSTSEASAYGRFSLLRLSLLRFVDSKLQGKFLNPYGHENSTDSA